MYLTGTVETLQIVLAGAVTTNESVVTVDYGENTATTFVAGKQRSVTDGTTAVDILSAPSASTQRIVQLLTMTNQDTAPITVTIRTNNAGTLAPQCGPITLQVGERLQFATDTGFTVYTVTGAVKVTAVASTVEPGYIDGMQMVWDSDTGYSVRSGTCYIPSSGSNVNFASMTTKSGLSLSADTWYHLYAFLNSGVPDIEHSTTAPSTPYNGLARTKTGDTTRRYIGSLRTIAAGAIAKFNHTANSVIYNEHINDTPFNVLNGGSATSPANVSCANCVPVTGRIAIAVTNNDDSVRTAIVGNPDLAGTLSIGNFNICFIPPKQNFSGPLPLDASQQFTYVYDAAPSAGNYYVRVSGYVFDR